MCRQEGLEPPGRDCGSLEVCDGCHIGASSAVVQDRHLPEMVPSLHTVSPSVGGYGVRLAFENDMEPDAFSAEHNELLPSRVRDLGHVGRDRLELLLGKPLEQAATRQVHRQLHSIPKQPPAVRQPFEIELMQRTGRSESEGLGFSYP